MHGNRKLTLSSDRALAGVCGGSAEFRRKISEMTCPQP